MYKNLPEIYVGKIIPKNFGHISHLTGSKLIDDEDKLLSLQEQYKYTVCKRNKNDQVIITEKLDGMNAGVIKKNGLLYPLNRKGYDSRTMEVIPELVLLSQEWAKWVDEHYELYDSLLNEGERFVFENCIIQHTLKYKFKCDPVFLLTKYTSDNKRLNYKTITNIAITNNIQQPPLLNIGIAIPPQQIIEQYPKGVAGVRDRIEGIVYNYEHNGEFESYAKFVSNEIMGTVDTNLAYYNIRC